jgi:hypothetical protein
VQVAEREQGVVVSHCILEKEVHGTGVEADMRMLEVGLRSVALVAVLENMDLRLGVDSFAGSKARQRLSKQRVLEN